MSKNHISSFAYRPDIDGLRAIAVLSVILFHLSKNAFPKGYLGVDIFFVISGFLIARIVTSELNEGTFSFVEFYKRRIKRILPVLAAVLITSTVFAVAILLPSDLIGYSKSLISSIFFFSNIYFWRDTNYFSPNAETKPLLHIWSLSLEEQFYIIFPAVLVLSFRLMRSKAIIALFAFTLTSWGAYVFLNYIGGGSPAFFLLPTRAWQLGVGACAGFYLANNIPVIPKLSAKITTAALSALVAATLNFIPASTVTLATLTTAATVIILFAADGKGAARNILSLGPLVYLGKISYSLYLWHWPVIVFYRYYLVKELSLIDMVICAILTCALAFLSYTYIEERFRGKSVSFKRVAQGLLAASATMSAVSALVMYAGGIPQRLSPEASKINEAVGSMYRCPVSEYISIGIIRGCNLNMKVPNVDEADTILLGNSHALMYAPVWTEILENNNRRGVLININGCLPTVYANISASCVKSAEANLDAAVNKSNIRTIVIGMTWWHFDQHLVKSNGEKADNSGNKELAVALDDLISRITHAGKKVILIGPIAQPRLDISSTLSRQIAFGWPRTATAISRAEYDRQFESVKAHFRIDPRITFAEPDKAQCNSEACEFVMSGKSLFADETHVARAELYRFKEIFEAAYEASETPSYTGAALR